MFKVNSAGRVNQGHFSRVPANVAAPRSTFDRSFRHSTTFSEGKLIPIFWEPILPGDTVKATMNILCRLSTPVFPYMDNVYLDAHWFFVPNRLLWSNWEKFQGAQEDPDDSTDFVVPSLDDATWSAGFGELSLGDYFGLPTKVASVPQADMPIALPFRAYNLIWKDWYRDENLQNSPVVDKSDGPDVTQYVLLNRNRRKDYFTSALPWPQKGPDVTLPLGSTAPVHGIGALASAASSAGPTSFRDSSVADVNYTNYMYIDAVQNGKMAVNGFPSGPNVGYPNIWADLSDATQISINSMRQSIVLQQMLELDARGGTRYVEVILSRFGVVSPDFRLQRPEFIAGQTLDINVNPIAQTSSSDSESAQGSLAAFGVARGPSRMTYSAVEHGQLLCLVSVRADTSYQQGLNRHWSVRTRYDYYEPLAANLGEQAILNKEIFMQGPVTPPAKGDNDVFGYQERWGEYRYKPSYVTGLFRSNATASLDSWHLAIEFPDLPELEDIIPETPPIERIVAVPSEPHFIFDSWTRFIHARVIPMYSAPGLTRL